MNGLLHAIQEIVVLTNEQQEQVKKCFYGKTLGKNHFFLEEGNHCNHIAFVVSGRLRVFYHDEEGRETTCYFAGENEFVSSYTSFLTLVPAKENVQAIEKTELLVVSKSSLEALSEKVPQMETFRRIMAENLFIAMERRVAMLQSEKAQLRYESLIKERPELVLNVPQQYLASFLGITPQHLSRLRKKY